MSARNEDDQPKQLAFDFGPDLTSGNHPQLVAIREWRCPNCGQHVFTPEDTDPPELCDYCDDMTTWQLVKRGM